MSFNSTQAEPRATPKGFNSPITTLQQYFGLLRMLNGAFEPESMALTCMPLFHVAGVNMGVFALAQGLTNVITKEVNPEEILDFIERYKINYALFVPAVILFLTQHPRINECDVSSLRKLFYGASPIAEDFLQAQNF